VAKGDIANELTPLIEDPNALIHEGKAFTCNLRKGRKPVKLDGGRP
jgi:formate dehydrogenase major subunit